MKKIIIYGVSIKNLEIRRSIEHFLDGGYEIAGYSDGHYTSDVLDNKTFIPLEELPERDFDFILLTTASANAYAEIRRSLAALGISPDKIIRPMMFLGKDGAKKQVDLIADIDRRRHEETGLIFGMSYSAWGILEEKLDRPFYNCSQPGMDLYYNYRVYRYMVEKGFLSRVETALFVLPYFYFEYDMSRSLGQYEAGQMFSIWRLDDWHHAREVPAAREYIENYRMFGEKISRFYHVPKQPYSPGNSYGQADGTAVPSPRWFSDYKDTIEENKALFSRFLQEIKAEGEAVVIVPPYYVNGLSRLSKQIFQAKKEKFYRILSELEEQNGKIRVFDYTDAFEGRRERFADLDHLNREGAEAFTELINREVLGGRDGGGASA